MQIGDLSISHKSFAYHSSDIKLPECVSGSIVQLAVC